MYFNCKQHTVHFKFNVNKCMMSLSNKLYPVKSIRCFTFFSKKILFGKKKKIQNKNYLFIFFLSVDFPVFSLTTKST